MSTKRVLGSSYLFPLRGAFSSQSIASATLVLADRYTTELSGQIREADTIGVKQASTSSREGSRKQNLAYKLLEIAESGPSEGQLIAIAVAVGFNYRPELLSLLREMEVLSDREIDQRTDRFIRECST
jgi:hypothetical protein